MKNRLFLIPLSIMSIHANAYHLDIKTQGFSATDTVSILLDAQKGDCQIVDGQYKCQKIHESTVIEVQYLDKLLDLYKHGYEDYQLTTLSFKINEKSFPSCENLQNRGQQLSVLITPNGCA